MNNFFKRGLVLIFILAIFYILIFWVAYTSGSSKKNININSLPILIGRWQGKEIPLDDLLKSGSAVMREYLNGDSLISLVIVYSNNIRVALDFPESWYSGKDSLIAMRGAEQIRDAESKDFRVKKLILTGSKGNRAILCYFETGGIRTPSYTTMRIERIKNILKSKPNGAALIGVSAVIKENKVETTQILKDFIHDTAPTLSKYLN